MQAKTLIELARPLNCLMAAFGVFIGYSIALGEIGYSDWLGIAMLVAFIICGAGQAINDVFDSKIDAKIRPGKPIPSKRISKKKAETYAISLFAIGNALALLLPIQAFLIAIVFSAILVLYSAKMQKAKYIGNWIVALGTAFTLIFGASLLQDYTIVIVLAIAALLANAAREIIKDAEDLKADEGLKVSLPMKTSMKNIKAIVLLLHGLAIVLGLFAFFCMGFGGILYLVLILISAVLFAEATRRMFKNQFRKAKNRSKLGMLIALIGFLAGVF